MTDLLNVSLIQSSLEWGDVEENLNHFSNLLVGLNEKTDLVILPEMFTSGFLMNEKERIAPYEAITLGWMQKQASKLHTFIVGSIIVEEQGQYFNRLYVVNQSGVMCSYDKRHLFRMGEENKHFSAGKERKVFKIGNWRICPLVCYDLRFPVWSRNTNDYDLLIYVANWPSARREVWNTLLKARAIENQTYVAGVNRIGEDGLNLTYKGGTCFIDAKGKLIAKCEDNKSEIISSELNLKDLKDFRKKFPVLLDADAFRIEI